MQRNMNVIVYPVKNAEKAKSFFDTFLGIKPYVDSPFYIGYRLSEIEIGLDPNSTDGPIAYIDVEDINASLKEMTDAGALITQEPKEVGGGLLIARFKDTDGNILGFRQHPQR